MCQCEEFAQKISENYKTMEDPKMLRYIPEILNSNRSMIYQITICKECSKKNENAAVNFPKEIVVGIDINHQNKTYTLIKVRRHKPEQLNHLLNLIF